MFNYHGNKKYSLILVTRHNTFQKNHYQNRCCPTHCIIRLISILSPVLILQCGIFIPSHLSRGTPIIDAEIYTLHEWSHHQGMKIVKGRDPFLDQNATLLLTRVWNWNLKLLFHKRGNLATGVLVRCIDVYFRQDYVHFANSINFTIIQIK